MKDNNMNMIELKSEIAAVASAINEIDTDYMWYYAHGVGDHFEAPENRDDLYDHLDELEAELQAESALNEQALAYEAEEARLIGLRVRG